MAKKWVYLFSEVTQACASLGGKGANLAEMTGLASSCSTGLYHHNRGLYSVL